MTVEFELDGQPFTALNGGPDFRFNEAISLQVHCETQEEMDYYWEKLSKGGDPKAQQCGWLKDRYRPLVAGRADRAPGIAQGSGSETARRAMEAMLRMKKIDVGELSAPSPSDPERIELRTEETEKLPLAMLTALRRP